MQQEGYLLMVDEQTIALIMTNLSTLLLHLQETLLILEKIGLKEENKHLLPLQLEGL